MKKQKIMRHTSDWLLEPENTFLSSHWCDGSSSLIFAFSFTWGTFMWKLFMFHEDYVVVLLLFIRSILNYFSFINFTYRFQRNVQISCACHRKYYFYSQKQVEGSSFCSYLPTTSLQIFVLSIIVCWRRRYRIKPINL